MPTQKLLDQFLEIAANAGAQIVSIDNLSDLAPLLAERCDGTVLLPRFSSAERLQLKEQLEKEGVDVCSQVSRSTVLNADIGITGVNFAIADTGSLVLESSEEEIRLATTFPTRHMALLDPEKIVADGLEAVKPLRQMHERSPRNYVAYITGPSRTADIERVLTIGVHGPKELYIILVPGLSNDLLEM